MQFATFPKRRLYPFLGFFLAVGAPGGLLLMRSLTHAQFGNLAWMANELSTRALTYGYIAVSTAVIFVGLGAIIGANEDLLQRVSLTDPLTGLPNRRHFDRRLREELARVDRYNQPLALMLLDLDGLKTVNDLGGHESGDNALRAVARSLQRTCRSTDLAARIGGDEFIVLAPNITEAEAEKFAERIRKTLTAEASWVSTMLPPLTLSIGVADTRCVSDLHPDRLYSVADRALYRAKQSGKNRVVLAGPEDDHPPNAFHDEGAKTSTKMI
jgi:diguanylate cyclase (GGDEF)-like protein